jgi:hypothetical protein
LTTAHGLAHKCLGGVIHTLSFLFLVELQGVLYDTPMYLSILF